MASFTSYPNTNKLIRIYKTGGNYLNDSWRENLSRIASSVKTTKPDAKFFLAEEVNDFAKKFDVDPTIHLLMDSDLPKFKTTNDFNAPLNELISKIGNSKAGTVINAIAAIGGAAKQFTSGNWTDSTGATSGTFQPWVQNLQAWNGSTPLGFNLEFNFAMGQYGLWNAREEVVKPILNLIAPTLPQHINAFTMSGNTPNSFNLIAEMITLTAKSMFTDGGGNTEEWAEVKDSFAAVGDALSAWDWSDLLHIKDLIDNITTTLGTIGNAIGTLLEFLVLNSFKRYTYTIDFGNMFTFNRMIIKNSDWSFAKEVDQNGLPVSGNVKLQIESMIPTSLSSSSKNNMFMRYKFDEKRS